jgi:hypothetical protein
MLEEAIAALYKPYFLVKANCLFCGVNSDFIQIVGASGEELSTDALLRKVPSDEQQR